MPAVSDAVWSAQGTTPDAIEAALRAMLAERHAEHGGYVPARALNMIAFVDRAWSGEIANRLRGVGRFHASRLVVLSYEPGRTALDARATVASEGDPRPGELTLLRETVVVELGDRHLDDLYTIADPLVVSDLPTLLWSPHGHPEVADELLGARPGGAGRLRGRARLARRRRARPHALRARLRGGPRLAALHPVARAPRHRLRPPAAAPRAVAARSAHDPPPPRLHDLRAAARRLARLAPRLGRAPADGARGRAHRRGPAPAARTSRCACSPPPSCRCAASPAWTLETAGGWRLRLDRGPGGLHAFRSDPRGEEREWTLLGASRGEAGILGEGIRQALLRDPTYAPALAAVAQMAP